jgi:hypothetical protein
LKPNAAGLIINIVDAMGIEANVKVLMVIRIRAINRKQPFKVFRNNRKQFHW